MLDLVFASYLLVLMPGWQLWKSLKNINKKKTPSPSGRTRLFRYFRSILTPVVNRQVGDKAALVFPAWHLAGEQHL